MSEPESFRSRDEEVSRLLAEIISLREIMREISRKLSNLELRAKRAFPNAVVKVQSPKPKSSISEPPTLSAQAALQRYDQVVERVRLGAHGEANELLNQMNLPDLHLMFKELGLSLGKSAPSKKTIISGILGRVKQSVMLSHHATPQLRNDNR